MTPPTTHASERLSDDQGAFLREPNYAVMTTLREDGSPHSTVTWVDWAGEHVLVNITPTRLKTRHLARDPRVAVLAIDRHDPYRWLSVSGTAEVTAEGAVEHIHALSRKYFGRDYTLRPGEERLIVRIRPERVTAYKV